jgi:N-acetyl-anhydromuramyl-L-alanine amidase AmpD
MNLKQIPFNNYIREESEKKRIVLHHTAGGGNAEIVYQGWQADRVAVATCVAISRDGTIVQGFASRYWGYHLGLKPSHFLGQKYQMLDKTSIGVEVCNWGPLVYKGGKFKNYVNGEVDRSEVIECDYRGFKFWQKYTDEQIESVRELLVHWGSKYGIPLDYNMDIWNHNKRAMAGESGVFVHGSFRPDKADLYPCPRMIEMLRGL